ncbi:type II toxin-antitoxin system RelE/ParE family toxin [Rhizobium sp. P32RR-XVIII]|uniref:type II toxin-antitoxin system RelE/ParE family toxin n=1 Tax=Rhizobium sp. P32RR-XVIII TaxID=2726738 RepID=UPI00145670EC|nr:type II toxin-antitoxin system RelE/ParE family toxin [Rhizobium sp. P32RR-XVIII]NLS06868.1 type II toxin-antitoxin system RelE/ParE family toxin [Rhizobium sp. P32RR-XVIII]
MTAYILTAEAESDLRSVIRYTRAQWSAAQVRRYVSALERGIANLAEGKAPFKDMSALYPALRMARCEHHYVFCLLRGDGPALIVAILHERMDLMKRLAGRLNE